MTTSPLHKVELFFKTNDIPEIELYGNGLTGCYYILENGVDVTKYYTVTVGNTGVAVVQRNLIKKRINKKG